jgi:hypothetical protein
LTQDRHGGASDVNGSCRLRFAVRALQRAETGVPVRFLVNNAEPHTRPSGPRGPLPTSSQWTVFDSRRSGEVNLCATWRSLRRQRPARRQRCAGCGWRCAFDHWWPRSVRPRTASVSMCTSPPPQVRHTTPCVCGGRAALASLSTRPIPTHCAGHRRPHGIGQP